MKIWFDTEFIDDGKIIDLISIGMVREDGGTYYAEPAGVDYSRAGKWVKENVLPHMDGHPMKDRVVIAKEILEFAGDFPEFWGWYGAYDWVALCQLYGRMMDLPKNWPMFVRDVRQLQERRVKLPVQNLLTKHNALADAQWTKQVWEYMMARRNG